MSSDVSPAPALAEAAPVPSDAPAPKPTGPRISPVPALILGVVALIVSLALWQKLAHIQETLALQSQAASQQSAEALTLARQASVLAQDASTRLTLAQSRLSELSAQRSQVDELLQSLSKAKDDNLVLELDTALRAAQQQAQLSGSVQPLLMALTASQQRIKRANVPRLVPVSLGIERDLQRIQQTKVMDLPVVLSQLDQLIDGLNQLALLGEALTTEGTPTAPRTLGLPWVDAVGQGQWAALLRDMWREVASLVQISRVDSGEVLMLSPDQRELVRQQMRLHVLSARLSVVARQHEAVQRDLSHVSHLLQRHAQIKTPQAKAIQGLVEGIQGAVKSHAMPALSDSLAALAALQSGR